MTQKTVFLLLGGNLGDRENNILEAKKYISLQIGHLEKESSLYQTAAWGVENQPSFLNQVIKISSLLSPQEILLQIEDIEKKLGRKRYQKWYARTIDVDILYYESDILEDEENENGQKNLKVPHPFLQERRFTLVPLVEIAPDFIHPTLQKTNTELLEKCLDKLPVKKYENRILHS
ncbi:2-amino-4-hydroxy-6-hydroxymethyldihydropteridine pyrophosphokinase [Bernardetia litoralis DSM 6794]|uniref:2-amino-4-hydroxy-6-hydroxymethyldihydropteridine pyrophosphokinase n=1 Tax=Bernardetia litoralis (strain ATCC 23117 / DSM 6794 / NBRC 15988 / NCIMB 1366 / Fx l1 / Sio-4) TaxID=880071 RepID=I4ANX6_BERLS|nr:2-amino-4-hydroxy-6-hydroxymethyldihydropteridine diphosphokinase [Bernardetia litoralis]AFM05661.1 2-amino-4-hydroxy-6-hydroxymethyldihydropteridine pyrophosphokinase [Bernardetia litoralis DSM 6794]